MNCWTKLSSTKKAEKRNGPYSIFPLSRECMSFLDTTTIISRPLVTDCLGKKQKTKDIHEQLETVTTCLMSYVENYFVWQRQRLINTSKNRKCGRWLNFFIETPIDMHGFFDSGLVVFMTSKLFNSFDVNHIFNWMIIWKGW